MPKIETLIHDMYEVIQGRGGWDKTITEYLSTNIAQAAEARFKEPQKPRGYLSLSSVGSPCKRRTWYRINRTQEAEPLKPQLLGLFFYGDLLETLILALARAAGHDVQGEQDRLSVAGVKGHRDAVIDGMTIDVKSSSRYGMQKFMKHQLREDDPYGYISQLSSYVAAGKDDPLVTNKSEGAFLVVQKDTFNLCLDTYDFTEEVKNKDKEVEAVKAIITGELPTDRIEPIPTSPTSENTKLTFACAGCEFRKICWPEARVFQYSSGKEYLIDVVKQPKVPELID
jgi:CRISPR/Cas system-associated exonuclease Cas4 (RecB family)|tara:strand:- start:1431 stop:2282 length:852 start_codon:yes stop_codon:yes gene_type:complete